jgi:hypothetical protein
LPARLAYLEADGVVKLGRGGAHEHGIAAGGEIRYSSRVAGPGRDEVFLTRAATVAAPFDGS